MKEVWGKTKEKSGSKIQQIYKDNVKRQGTQENQQKVTTIARKMNK